MFMKGMYYRPGFKVKTNKKKKTTFFVISSNRTFYVTFGLSIIFHIGLIYTIPAVDLFSEGLDGASSEAIIVDFFQEEPSVLTPEAAPADDNQFQAKVSPIPPEQFEEEAAAEPEPEPVDIERDSPPSEKITDLENDYTLISEALISEPELHNNVIKRQFSQKLPTHIPQSRPQQAGKVLTKPIRPDVRLTQPRIEINEPIKISHLNKKTLPQQEESEVALRFPLPAKNPKEAQHDNSEEFPKSQFEFGKRQLVEIKKTTPPVLSAIELPTASIRKRQFGITKDRETDKNKFGIFAGRKFEAPTLKEYVRGTIAEKEEQQISDVTQTAEVLQTESQIEGPVKGRALLRRARPPQVDNIAIDVELKLKFWVLPDGTIGEVIPIKRGNAELEQIAIAYLKKWQFEPLAEGEPQQEIWGTIPIRFSVR